MPKNIVCPQCHTSFKPQAFTKHLNNAWWCQPTSSPRKDEMKQHSRAEEEGNHASCMDTTADTLIGTNINVSAGKQPSSSHKELPPDAEVTAPRRSTRTLRLAQTSTHKSKEPTFEEVASIHTFPDFDETLDDFIGELDREPGHIAIGSQLAAGKTTGTQNPSLEEDTMAAVAHLPQQKQQDPQTTEFTKLMACEYNLKCTLGQTFHFPIENQNQLHASRFFGIDKVLAKLHYTCYAAGAPRYLADQILNVLREGQKTHGFHLNHPAITQRESLMKRLQLSVTSPPPVAITVNLESGLKTTILRFDFLDRLQRHLLSPTFANHQNIDLTLIKGQQLPFVTLEAKECTYRNFTAGQWYQQAQETYAPLIETGNYLLHPLVGYMDKTGVDKIEKNALEPVALTSAILSQEEREKAENWMLLGYIPSLKWLRQQKSKTTTSNDRSMSIRDYHHCLAILLEPFKNVQKEKPVLVFRRGNEAGAFRVILPLVAMTGDNLSGDQLAQRVADSGASSPRLSRRCLCPAMKSDAPIHKCHKLPEVFVRKLSLCALGVTYGCQSDAGVAEGQRQNVIPESPNLDGWKRYLDGVCTTTKLRVAALQTKKRRMKISDLLLHKVLGSHALLNAFTGVDFGPTTNGILEATTTDLMHTVEEGLIPRILHVFFDLMPNGCLEKIDEYVESLFGPGCNRNGEKEQFPRVTFRQGYTKLTNLSASERLGQLFILAIILQTKKGQDLLDFRFQPDFDSERAKRLATQKKKGKGRKRKSGSHEDNPQEGVDSEEGEEDQEDNNDSDAEGTQGIEAPQQQELSWEDIKKYLTHIQLDYVHKSLYPCLPEHHQQLLRKLLKDKIKPRWLVNVAPIVDLNQAADTRMPDLDYLPMDLTRTVLPEPQECLNGYSHQHIPMERDLESTWRPLIARNQMDNENVPRSVALTPNELVYLVETILCFHACVKDPSHLRTAKDSTRSNEQLFSLAVSAMIRCLVHGISRGKGTKEWKLRKVVELSHFLHDILQFGSADGFNSSTGERNLKIWAKLPSATAQNRTAVVHLKQTASRIHEAFLLEQATKAPVKNGTTSSREGNTSEKYTLCTLTGKCFKDIGARPREVVGPLSPSVIQWFQNEYKEDPRKISIFTETKVFGEICRAHADYRKGGPWYDYVQVSMEQVDAQGNVVDNPIPTPCRLAAIWFHKDEEEDETGTMMALLQVGTKKPSYLTRDRHSMLFSHWQMEFKAINQNQPAACHQALFQSCPLDMLDNRIYCVDVGAFLDGDPFSRQPNCCPESCDILWSSRENWAKGFLQSPDFLKAVSTGGRKRARSRR